MDKHAEVVCTRFLTLHGLADVIVTRLTVEPLTSTAELDATYRHARLKSLPSQDCNFHDHEASLTKNRVPFSRDHNGFNTGTLGVEKV